jgi:hypothetical protein
VTSLGAGRRTLILLALVAIAGTPAVVLRAFCAGHSCDEPANASSEVPFCSLPEGIRSRVAAGFREGRSPDLLAVAAAEGLVADESRPRVPWPSTIGGDATEVPIAFFGDGIDPGATVPDGTGLDDVAATVADVIGFDRPHPDVRSGEAVEGIASGSTPRLVVEIVWVGRGPDELERAPLARKAISAGPSTLEGDTTSLPVDPAAVLTTIGTGGRPSQHGITGAFVLGSSFGADDVPDLAVVVVESGPRGLDEVFRTVLKKAGEVSNGSVAFVFTATGRTGGDRVFDPATLPGDDVASLVERVMPGGLFLDQDELARRQVSEDEVLRSLASVRDGSGGPLFADAFPAIAVAFGRYC